MSRMSRMHVSTELHSQQWKGHSEQMCHERHTAHSQMDPRERTYLLAKGYSLGSLSQTYDKSERLSDSSITIWIIIDHLLYDLVCAFDIVERSISPKA